MSASLDLVSVFMSGEKPAEKHGIGIEYERLPVDRQTGRAVPYAAPTGPRGEAGKSIEALLEALSAEHGWEATREQGHITSLHKEGTRVTLEPGAQIEMSGQIHRSLKTAREEVTRFVQTTSEVASRLGVSLLGLGYHPFSDFIEIGWVPKSRYRIMAPYLASRGHLAHGMMKGTAGCQVNLDYSSEADAMDKMRVAMAVSSIVTALCANSPLARGQANGFATKRSHIWLHTDPDRCGLLRWVFDEGAKYADYVSYALSVPMLFVLRDGELKNMTGRTFNAYLDGDDAGLTPTLADWRLHLTTLFPEVRLKSYLEVRGSDSGSPDMILAQAALWKGLLYDDRARTRAFDMVERASFEERLSFHRDVSRLGLQAALRGDSALDLAQSLVRLAEQALPPDEASLLEPLRRIAQLDRASPADLLLKRWSGEWRRDPRRLVASLDPEPELTTATRQR